MHNSFIYLFYSLTMIAFFSPTEANNKESDAIGIVETYNARNFGSPGKRQVLIELKNNGLVTRSFQVTNLWIQEEDKVKTLFFLDKPNGLKGTCYLLTEDHKSEVDMGVHLYLPSGKQRVLSITPDHFDQGLLGSDFGYSDLRMQLPTQGYKYQKIGKTSINDFPVWIIRVEPTTAKTKQQASWTYANIYITVDFPFLMEMDYYQSPSAASTSNVEKNYLYKQMRVECLDNIDGVWTASRMVMIAANGQSTELSLENIEFNLNDIKTNLFNPEVLPQMQKHIAQ